MSDPWFQPVQDWVASNAPGVAFGALASLVISRYYYQRASKDLLGERGRIKADTASRVAVAMLTNDDARVPSVERLVVVLTGDFRRLNAGQGSATAPDAVEVLEMAAAEADRHTMVGEDRRARVVDALVTQAQQQRRGIPYVERGLEPLDLWLKEHGAFVALALLDSVTLVLLAAGQVSGHASAIAYLASGLFSLSTVSVVESVTIQIRPFVRVATNMLSILFLGDLLIVLALKDDIPAPVASLHGALRLAMLCYPPVLLIAVSGSRFMGSSQGQRQA